VSRCRRGSLTVVVALLLLGCQDGDPGAGGPAQGTAMNQPPFASGGASEAAPAAQGASDPSGAPALPMATPSEAGQMPSAQLGSPSAGLGSAGASAAGNPAQTPPGASGPGTIPVIDGPPPPAIRFDEFEIPSPSQPGWITAGPDGQIWFTHQSTAPSAISKLTTQGTQFVQYATSITNTGPRGIAPGPDGNVWYSKQGGIGRMQPNGTMNEYAVPNGGDSAGIALGPDGNLWFTQQLDNRISRVTPGAQFQGFDVPTPDSGPLAITAGSDGNLWFTEAAATANKIGRITPSGQISEYAIPTPASNPTGITPGPGGELWFTLHDVAKLGKITRAGAITEFYIPSGNRPSRIIQGPDGNLWFTLAAANAVGRSTPLGQVSEYAIPTPAGEPYDIALGPDGNLWFTELSSNKIGRVSNLAGGGNAMASEGGARGGKLGADTACRKDTDCVESGQTCGGDVCGVASVCVLAVSGDPGACASDNDCWCKGRGASCANGHCSFLTADGRE